MTLMITVSINDDFGFWLSKIDHNRLAFFELRKTVSAALSTLQGILVSNSEPNFYSEVVRDMVGNRAVPRDRFL